MKWWLTLVLALTWMVPAQARLGETAAQLERRFGAPVRTVANPKRPGTVVHFYRHGPLAVEARLDGGTVTYVCYRQKAPFSLGQVAALVGRNVPDPAAQAGGKFVLEKGVGVFADGAKPESCWCLHLFDASHPGAQGHADLRDLEGA